MRLPLILERALVACSGAPPGRVRMIREQHPDSFRLRGVTAGGAPVGSFDPNYSEHLPTDYPRLWLEYEQVPSEVAMVVSQRLGCRLDEIGDRT